MEKMKPTAEMARQTITNPKAPLERLPCGRQVRRWASLAAEKRQSGAHSSIKATTTRRNGRWANCNQTSEKMPVPVHCTEHNYHGEGRREEEDEGRVG